MKLSKELKEFYRDLQEWIDAGMPESHTFSCHRAICSSLQVWIRYNSGYCVPAWQLAIDNKDLFLSCGLHATYPFNHGESCKWEGEALCGNFYENPERLAFIKEMARWEKGETLVRPSIFS